MTNSNFQELKRLFDAECEAMKQIKEEGREARIRAAPAYVIAKLLHGLPVREAYGSIGQLRSLIDEACAGTTLNTDVVHPTFTVYD